MRWLLLLRWSYDWWWWWRHLHYGFWIMFEGKLEEELLCFFVPVSPKSASIFINFSARNFESNGFIRLGSKQQVLPLLVRWLHLLFVGCHKTMSWYDAINNFWIINLKQQTLLTTFWISLFGHFVTRSSDLNEFFNINSDLLGSWLSWCFLGFFSSTSCKICLMFFALSVGQIAAFIVM